MKRRPRTAHKGEISQMQLKISAEDPLLCDFALPLRSLHYHLGFPVEIVTNSNEVLTGAEESWGNFGPVFSQPPVQIRIGVLKGDSSACPPPPVVRSQQNLLINIADRENFVVSDMRRGFAFGWLTEATVRDRAYLRYYFLEGVAWTLLEPLYLTSIHGACVGFEGRGVLLCGDSGAGKSSLAYACARRGWTFLSDDSSCLVRKRPGRVVTGNPNSMRFRESAAELFPELKTQPVTRRLSGDMAIELPTASMPGIKTWSECPIDYIVFLNRKNPDPSGLSPFPKQRALQWFEQVVCYGEEDVRILQKASLQNLLAAEVFELRYSDLATAISHLETLVLHGASVTSESCTKSGD
jgi:hypothetical protein